MALSLRGKVWLSILALSLLFWLSIAAAFAQTYPAATSDQRTITKTSVSTNTSTVVCPGASRLGASVKAIAYDNAPGI